MFAYTITIRNRGTVPAKLLSRHWLITDADGKVQEVRGGGVVGEQPHLMPGQGFRYYERRGTGNAGRLDAGLATRCSRTTACSSTRRSGVHARDSRQIH